jgi:Flp pilus assembly protein TadD
VNDTLGWVYCKKQLYSLALPLLTAASAKEPTNAIFKYHLGLAYAGAGQSDRARQALQQALALDSHFPGADDARHLLESL